MSINYITLDQALQFLSARAPQKDLVVGGSRPSLHLEGAQTAAKKEQPLKTQKKVSMFFIGVGIALILGSIFMCLANFNVLPQTANAMSNLGAGGHALGFGLLSVGSLTTIIAGVMLHRRQVAYQKNQGEASTQFGFALRNLLAPKLAPHELLVVSTPGRKWIDIFHSSQPPERPWMDNQCYQTGLHHSLPSTEESFREAFKKQLSTRGIYATPKELEEDVRFLSLSDLRARWPS